MNKNLLSLYGLKWNPFTTEIPIEGIVIDQCLENFYWRLENLVMDGGFAMISGPVGTGKSVSLRWIAEKLKGIKDVQVVSISRPQSGIADFYRELGDLFALNLQVTNRFASFRGLRDKWTHHIESTLLRPVLVIDEAQEMHSAVLSELRLMVSRQFDSQSMLTVILCGDERLGDKFREPQLMPLGSRIKTRLLMESKSRDDLAFTLKEMLKKAGSSTLMTDNLITTIAERSMGNYRAMMQISSELLQVAAMRKENQIDDKLFFETFNYQKKSKSSKGGAHVH